jgi:hypothetical protein
VSRTPAAALARLKVEYQQYTFDRWPGIVLAWHRSDPFSALVAGSAGQLEAMLLERDPHRGRREAAGRGLH